MNRLSRCLFRAPSCDLNAGHSHPKEGGNHSWRSQVNPGPMRLDCPPHDLRGRVILSDDCWGNLRPFQKNIRSP
jgi:hypothetical protein